MVFKTTGNKSNSVILFFHAMGVTGESSMPVAEKMAEKYYCIMPTSTVYCSGQRYQSKRDEIQQIVRFLGNHGIKEIELIVASSIGADLAMAFLTEIKIPVKHVFFDGGQFVCNRVVLFINTNASVILIKSKGQKFDVEVIFSFKLCRVHLVFVSLFLHDFKVCLIEFKGVVGFEPSSIKAVNRHAIRMRVACYDSVLQSKVVGHMSHLNVVCLSFSNVLNRDNRQLFNRVIGALAHFI